MKKSIQFVAITLLLTLAFQCQVSGQRKQIKPIRIQGKNIRVAPTKKTTTKKTTAKRTKFDPKKHGFEFANTFTTDKVIKDVRFGGLCGGMSYSALDYYFAGKDAPNQHYRPANNTTLFKHIYSRQEQSILQNVDKWAELIVNPFGARSDEFFRWGLEGKRGGRIWELASKVDAGKPVPLGLFRDGDGGLKPHHQVVATGYDKGRYRGDLGKFQEDFKIFIYDPNYPNRTMTLVPDLKKKDYYYKEAPSVRWKTYFVDMKYRPKRAPHIASVATRDDGMVRQLFLTIRTGGDDLRGGKDNLNVTVKYKNGKTYVRKNINRGGRWINNYTETVAIKLPVAVKREDIKSVVLQTTFGGGVGGDNWNMDCLTVHALVGTKRVQVYHKAGRPVVRFNGDNRPYEATFKR